MTRLSTAPAAGAVSQPLLAPRPSIVVLPFAKLSNDPDQQYFADAITEDLTTDLSQIAHMFVISSNTAFTYRNKPVETKQIGRELGVQYCARRKRPAVGQPGPRHRAADQGRHRRADLGRPV
jgi:TolB-like protein